MGALRSSDERVDLELFLEVLKPLRKPAKVFLWSRLLAKLLARGELRVNQLDC